jgi:hypothetical protein
MATPPTAALQWSDWVVITDSTLADAMTQRQGAALRARGCPDGVTRVIDCGDNDPGVASTCQALPAFPAMCHLPTKQCSAGVHETDADFLALVRLADAPSV